MREERNAEASRNKRGTPQRMRGTPFGSKNVVCLLIFPQGNSIISSQGNSTESIPGRTPDPPPRRPNEGISVPETGTGMGGEAVAPHSRIRPMRPGIVDSRKARRLHVVQHVHQRVVVVDGPLVEAAVVVDVADRSAQDGG